jgi:hypothetical protein
VQRYLDIPFFREHFKKYNPNEYLEEKSCTGFHNSDFSKTLARSWRPNRLIIPISSHGDAIIHSKHSLKGGEQQMAPVFIQLLSFVPSLRARTVQAVFLVPGPHSQNTTLYYEIFVKECNDLYENMFNYTEENGNVLEIWVLLCLCVGDGKWVPYYTGHAQQPARIPIHTWQVVGRKVKKESGRGMESYPYYDDVWRLLPKSHWLRKFFASKETAPSKRDHYLYADPYHVNNDQDLINRLCINGERATANGVPDHKHPYQVTGWIERSPFTKYYRTFRLWLQAQYDSAHVVSYYISFLFIL